MKKYLIKILASLLIISTLLYVGSVFLEKKIMNDIPPMVASAIAKTKSSKYIVGRIGPIVHEEYKYGPYNERTDSISYSIFMVGEKASIKIKANEKNESGKWYVCKSDTLILNNND